MKSRNCPHLIDSNEKLSSDSLSVEDLNIRVLKKAIITVAKQLIPQHPKKASIPSPNKKLMSK